MNRNKKPIQGTFGLWDSQGNWVSREEDIKRQLQLQWEKIFNSGCWPNSKLNDINTELKLDPDDIDKMKTWIQLIVVG